MTSQKIKEGTQTIQRQYKKRKLQISIPYEYGCKNSVQTISKQNLAVALIQG